MTMNKALRRARQWGWLLAACMAPAAAPAAESNPGKAPPSAETKPGAGSRAALAVEVVSPHQSRFADTVEATGNVAAWQEASVSPQAQGLRVARVLVTLGNQVRRGDVMLEFDDQTLRAELDQLRANVAEAEAAVADAAANAQRARQVRDSGALSVQQVQQLLTSEATANARLQALRESVKLQQLRVKQARLLAPDDGIVSARSATLGAVVPAGMELFRIIRKGRLEWRADVPASALPRLQAGMPVRVDAGAGVVVSGTVRLVSPTVDPVSRNALVYVDLPASSAVRPGMFARGEFQLGHAMTLALPQAAVQLRDGFSYVLRVGADGRVAQTKVSVGRRQGDQVEITGGLPADARVVASGGAFLSDGDLVRITGAPK